LQIDKIHWGTRKAISGMLNIIVACGRSRVIGKAGRLPWNIPEDWEYFLETTKSGTLIMGKHCFAEMGRHRKDRKVIALSRDPKVEFPKARKAGSLPEALTMAKEDEGDVWICGGRIVYEEAMPLADRLYLTLIDAEFEGDLFFPAWEHLFTEELSRRESESSGYRLTFLTLAKNK
jgi:dihydrofolate reductase